MVDKKAFPVILSGASGVGKTAVGRLILDAMPSLVESVSFTTREPRRGEEDGIDYHFITEKEFLAKVDSGAFVEWARVHEYYYGTSLKRMKEVVNRDIFAILDVQGALHLKKQMPHACLIFLMPPSMEELERRLRKRSTDKEEIVQLRLKNALTEHTTGLRRYDYVVRNNNLETALADILACIRVHRMKLNNQRENFDSALFESV